MRRAGLVMIGLILAWLVAGAVAVATPARMASTSIVIDGASTGLAFQGIGAISGGGGNSRLLIDYPEPERSRILDYLFAPRYGASLQLLKLEIGGDTYSSDGAEPSHEHTRGHVDCNAGYEWWIAEQAVKRNPSIKLYGLQWGAPGWTGTWTSADIAYLLHWLGCATQHGLRIAYLGGWNERYPYDAGWFISLRRALDASGYHRVQIVAADSFPGNSTSPAVQQSGAREAGLATAIRPGAAAARGGVWQIAADMAADPQLRRAIAVIGAHDTCGYPTTGYTCYSTSTARGLHKPLWESELGAMDANAGADDMARAINNGYIQAGISGYLEWPLIDAMASGLPYENRGLITADQPWSGYYRVNLMTWAIAQTTQFVPIGWLHVRGAAGALAGGGTYNAYEASNRSRWSMVAETTTASAPQNIRVDVRRLGSRVVHVWATGLASGAGSTRFARWRDVTPSGGVFSYKLPPGYAVTFTTTTGQRKGAASVPRPATMAVHYRGLLEHPPASVPLGEQAHLLAAQEGAFEYANCGDGSRMHCVHQLASGTPTWWWAPHDGIPYAVLGDRWTQPYAVSVELAFTNSGQTAGVIGRFSHQAPNAPEDFDGYELEVSDSGHWQLLRNSSSGAVATLADGQTTPLALRTWHQLTLSMGGATISASIDGRQQPPVAASPYGAGPAGIMTGGFYDVAFRNLTISGTAGP